MRDEGAFWTPTPDWSSARIERNGWSARAVPAMRQVLVSGAIEDAAALLAPDAPQVGLWEPPRRCPAWSVSRATGS